MGVFGGFVSSQDETEPYPITILLRHGITTACVVVSHFG